MMDIYSALYFFFMMQLAGFIIGITYVAFFTWVQFGK